MDELQFHEIDSPIGRIGVVVSPAGVAKVLFESDDIDAEREKIGAEAVVPLAAAQLSEYFSGQRREFTVPLDFRFATGFREEVLRELARVPYGQTTTYRELAKKVGNPKAVRAVGGACANNPLPLLVPCHRVLRVDGELGGYRGGSEMKRFLLGLEGIDVERTR
ncbi:methylated-DNA--[protein]-cysteine S-methyltransferase [Corynebacterium sp. P3-F1]|uniref:methylated-DNA--[protein]-cysteine S-methyltransferase n=1 Tax=Corynebacterium sp. P3-F1 TaxID=3059080 RepID=UPI00265CE3C4|nr:methylated-DNA--[protein]-cysteine S-methyltransferase [Corynebacterium sp. P3-F1]WKK62075.1 methylated-DNA--[protein]-cysteine S-methyltransferase [Corynebacterium sp. P3-F1]